MAWSKYGNRKTTLHGFIFDSGKEANRYLELVMLQNSGVITNLELQKEFELIPKQEGERPVKYKADFSYYQDGKKIVEDVKGYTTKDYIIKRKLMLFIHGIKIIEIK